MGNTHTTRCSTRDVEERQKLRETIKQLVEREASNASAGGAGAAENAGAENAGVAMSDTAALASVARAMGVELPPELGDMEEFLAQTEERTVVPIVISKVEPPVVQKQVTPPAYVPPARRLPLLTA